VIVAPETRGQQLARPLMREALVVCEQRWPGVAVELGAQAHLTGFYGSLGFEAVSEPYDDDGIPHVWMRRPRP
jgi:ElaA protein